MTFEYSTLTVSMFKSKDKNCKQILNCPVAGLVFIVTWL